MNSIGLNSLKGVAHKTGGGYVFIPSDVEREDFVESCYRTGRISIVRDNSFGIMNNVRVDIDSIQDIEFPEKTGKLGSFVVWVLDPFKKIPYVVAVLAKDSTYRPSKENQRFFQKETENGTVTVSIDGENVTIDVISEGKGGLINIINRGGNINIKSDNDVNVETAGKINITSKDSINIESKLVKQNKGDEPSLRGEKTVKLLEELIDLLFKSRVSTTIGLQPLTNFIEINKLKDKLEDLKSEKSFIE